MYNYLKQNGLRLTIKEAPGISFTCQSATLPNLNLSPANQASPFINLPQLGDKLLHDNLDISFIVYEDLSNYIEMHDWMQAIGFPNSYDDFSSLKQKRDSGLFPFKQKNDNTIHAYSDIILHVMDSNNNVKFEVEYRDAWPVSLSRLEFDVTRPDLEYITVHASFVYTNHFIHLRNENTC
jgi:hypothetical protein